MLSYRQWFSVACQQRHHHGHIRQTAIVKAAKSMIPSSVSIISSRWVEADKSLTVGFLNASVSVHLSVQ